MTLSNNLHLYQGLKQELGLKLTPEMRLRLDVLQATHLELKDILNKELEENPILEDVVSADETERVAEHKDNREKTEDVNIDGDGGHMDEISGEEYENVFEKDSFVNPRDYQQEYNPEIGKIRDFKFNSIQAEGQKGLQGELTRQLNSLKLDDENYNAVFQLIQYVDDNGFITDNVDIISSETGIPEEHLLRAKEILFSFEPAGVGASGPRECILVQLKQLNMKDSIAYMVADKYFDELARQQYKKIAAALKVSEENIKKAENAIKELSPYPGKNFSSETNEYVVPDIIVDENDKGEFEVKVVGDFPDIRINKAFLKEYKSNKQTKEFIRKYENRIKTLISSLTERNKTTEKVVEKLIDIQRDFMKNEEAGLKPLTLKEVAEDVGVHESTISRIVSRKYIQIPAGVYPLKKFFSSKLKSSEGDVSSDLVRGRIRSLIEGEESKKPFTDTEIASKLQGEGIKISRRTVTKYREQMGVLAANIRKK